MPDKKPHSLLQKTFIDSHVEKLPPQTAIFIDQDANCIQAIEALIAHKIGCLLIKGRAQTISGIFTERDVLNKVAIVQKPLEQILVKDVMTQNPQTLKYHASIAKAVYLMATGGFRHIPIIQRDNSWSIISVTDFIRFIFKRVSQRNDAQEDQPAVFESSNEIERFFEGTLAVLTPSKPLHLSIETTVEDVVNALIKNKTGVAVIGDPQKRNVAGLFTERDLIKKYMLKRAELASKKIKTLMTTNPVTLQPTTSVLYALDAMTQGKFRHLPIVDFDEKLTGILSVKNFLAFISKGIVDQLTKDHAG